MIYGDGTRMTFAGTMSTVLKPHAKGFFDDVKAAIELAEAEVGESYINGPHAGHPFEPSISHSCNLVITIRNGKLKQRGVGDLTGRGDLEEYSTNAGREIDDLSLEYVTSADFCRALFVISLIGIALEIRKFDWRNFYRQCLRHPAEWWLQVCMRLGTGLFVDERKIMGDSTCCFTGNAVETILVWLIRWLLMTEVWGFDAVLMRQPQLWFAAVLAQPWAQDRRVRDWMLHRRRIFGEPRPDQSRADQMHALWNLLPAILAGYFDDTMTGGIPGLIEQITTAVSSPCKAEVQDSTRLEPASAVNEISNPAQLQGERPVPSSRAEIVALSGRKRFPSGAFLFRFEFEEENPPSPRLIYTSVLVRSRRTRTR